MSVRKVEGGWVVVSKKKGKDGKRKRLSKVYSSREAAVNRLGQIEFFKHQGK